MVIESDALYTEALSTFRTLLAEAEASGEPEPIAMNLATADAKGQISSRIVLLKNLTERGFYFFTNYESEKGLQLAEHAQVAICFHWKKLRDQVQARIQGVAQRLSAEESDAYFATRPRLSQIGAWASLQSQTLPNRETFEARVKEVEQRFADGQVPRPPNWGGYVVAPQRIEFWYGAKFRLHDRVCYEQHNGVWSKRLLYP